MIVMPRRLSDEVASRVRALIEEQQLAARGVSKAGE